MPLKTRVSCWSVLIVVFTNADYLISIDATCLLSANGSKIMEKNTNYWSQELEEVVFKNKYKSINLMKLDLAGKRLKKIDKGCGKMLNRLGVLTDGSMICIRFRENFEQIQGEFISYSLSRLLGFENVLETKLLLFNKSEEFFKQIELKDETWKDLQLVLITRFVEDARIVKLPDILLINDLKLNANSSLCGLEEQILKSLIQWSDMVIFDYLIGNFDRFVSNMFNLQWYSQSLVSPVENLIQIEDGFWVLIDNEDGLSHGYRLLQKYEPFLKTLLANLCIFRAQTVMNIERLSHLNEREIWESLWHEAELNIISDRVKEKFNRLSDQNLYILKHRIDIVNQYIKRCNQKRS